MAPVRPRGSNCCPVRTSARAIGALRPAAEPRSRWRAPVDPVEWSPAISGPAWTVLPAAHQGIANAPGGRATASSASRDDAPSPTGQQPCEAPPRTDTRTRRYACLQRLRLCANPAAERSACAGGQLANRSNGRQTRSAGGAPVSCSYRRPPRSGRSRTRSTRFREPPGRQRFDRPGGPATHSAP